jgi:hypothetical protein
VCLEVASSCVNVSNFDCFERVQYPEEPSTKSVGFYLLSVNTSSDKCPLLSRLSIYCTSFHVTDFIRAEKKSMCGESFRKKNIVILHWATGLKVKVSSAVVNASVCWKHGSLHR